MKAVLYSHALRPLAILSLTDYEARRLRAGALIPRPVDHETDPTKMRVVPLVGERLRRGEHETFALFAADEADDELLYRHYGRD